MKSKKKAPVSSFEAEGEAQDLEFKDDQDPRSTLRAQANTAYDDREEPESWEGATLANTGRRSSDSSYVKGTVPEDDGDQEPEDLKMESGAQSGGDRAPQRTTVQRKHGTKSKSSTGEPEPKRANPLTRSNYGAAERREGEPEAQGITAHPQVEEDRRQQKVVAIRNDAKAGGSRTGSKRRAG